MFKVKDTSKDKNTIQVLTKLDEQTFHRLVTIKNAYNISIAEVTRQMIVHAISEMHTEEGVALVDIIK